MKIAILGAMKEEIEPILSCLDNKRSSHFASNTFYEGSLDGRDVIVAYSKIGKVFSSITAFAMIEHFYADTVIFSGVAGAVSEGLKIGDIIVATKLVQHDVDITSSGHPYGFIPESSTYIDCDQRLLKLAIDVAKEKDIDLKEGIVATGDQFVISKDRKDWIRKTFDASALEMEGASVALTCKTLDIPFLVIRTISDSSDGDAEVDFNNFLVESANVSGLFVREFVSKL